MAFWTTAASCTRWPAGRSTSEPRGRAFRFEILETI
jgi:hypothetical protein